MTKLFIFLILCFVILNLSSFNSVSYKLINSFITTESSHKCIQEKGEFCLVANERCRAPYPRFSVIVLPQSDKIELARIPGIRIKNNEIYLKDRKRRTEVFRILGNVIRTGVEAGTIGIPAIIEYMYYSGNYLNPGPTWVYAAFDFDSLPNFENPQPLSSSYPYNMWMYTKDVKSLKIDFPKRCGGVYDLGLGVDDQVDAGTPPSGIAALFSSTDDSIFQRTKLAFYPWILCLLTIFILKNTNYKKELKFIKNYTSALLGYITYITLIPLFFYIWTQILEKEPNLIYDIFSFIVSIVIGIIVWIMFSKVNIKNKKFFVMDKVITIVGFFILSLWFFDCSYNDNECSPIIF